LAPALIGKPIFPSPIFSPGGRLGLKALRFWFGEARLVFWGAWRLIVALFGCPTEYKT
jgi:hypothetical protein